MSEVGLDPQTIYSYDNHKNIPWNMEEYQPVREYLDPRKMSAKQPGSQPQLYVTKKGSFIDQHIKLVKDLPAPCKYQFPSEFDQTLNIKQSRKYKIDFKLRKNSYLQQIQSKEKRFKNPGVGQYHLDSKGKSKKSSNKHIVVGDKRYFYQDSEFLSTCIPGSGCYNPHDSIKITRKQRHNHEFWIEKHSKQNKTSRNRRLKQTDPGTYRPLSATFNTFDKIKIEDQRKKKKMGNKKTSSGFGSSDAKFVYQRSSKSKIDPKPDPGHYNTMIEWKGKGLDSKTNNWVRCVSAGPSRSIYH